MRVLWHSKSIVMPIPCFEYKKVPFFGVAKLHWFVLVDDKLAVTTIFFRFDENVVNVNRESVLVC